MSDTSSTMAWVDPATLRAGDVLLMRGLGPVSDLIAWFGDSTYSHAALMVDAQTLVEAALPTSRTVLLQTRLAQADAYAFIDVYRPTRADGTPLRDADRQAIARAGGALTGVAYPLDGLLQLAVVAALRNRIPADAGLRWLLRMLIDHLLTFDPTHMVCSELVYTALRDAGLPPTLIVSAQLDLPLPPIDVPALIEEWRAAHAHAHTLTLDAASAPIGADETAAAFARLRAARGLQPMQSLGMSSLPAPNPANVLPVDLETSPQLRRLGRLALAGQ
ncbi:hypothetical protein [Thermomonas alba]|uniref:hypothetical protein n=1 Tax=Thermomonas alba TaxID=2888525 RepID=UPI001F04FE23|nr:hypothetical protein [Thermomonas alba]